MAKSKVFITKAAKAGSRALNTSLKTYIPAKIVKKLGIENGDQLFWQLRRKKILIKVVKSQPRA